MKILKDNPDWSLSRKAEWKTTGLKKNPEVVFLHEVLCELLIRVSWMAEKATRKTLLVLKVLQQKFFHGNFISVTYLKKYQNAPADFSLFYLESC